MSGRFFQRNQDDAKELDCLEKCLQKLSPQQRQLIEDYYQGEGWAKIEKRKQLAARMGISISDLRIRAHRLRQKLVECVRSCIAQPEP